MTNNIILILTMLLVLALLCLVLFVAFSPARKSAKILFANLCLMLGLWITANTGADVFGYAALFWTRFAFVGAALTLSALVIFVAWFPKRLNHASLIVLSSVMAGAIIAAVSLTRKVVPEIVQQDGYANVITGEWYWLYVAYVVLMILAAAGLLLVQLRSENGINKERVKYIMAGVVVTALVAITTNLAIPLFTGENPLAIYGSLSAVGFIVMVAYSMIHSQLFNIRIATARAVAYLLSGMTLALFFGIFILWLDNLLFAEHRVVASQKIFYTFSAVLIGFSFPHIKKFFDNLTHHIFLRDMYDPREVLTRVASIISYTKDTESLFGEISNELHSRLHLSFVDVYVLQKNKRGRRRAHVGDRVSSSILNIAQIQTAARGVIISLEEMQRERSQGEEISMVVLLKTAQSVIGYITIGYKQNGTTFTPDDKSLLEAVANEMAIAAENLLRLEAIEQFNETLQGRVNEATKKLRASNVRLKQLDASKDDFISMASHQLRTPLTSIKGYISMVLDGDMGQVTPEQRKVLEEAFSSSQRMVYLISDFLNVSRLQTGKFELEKSQVQLPLLIADEIEQLRASAKARNTQLVYEAPKDFPALMLDENKIRQVMMNFIDNAIYYGKPGGGGTITVTLAKQSHYITFQVADDGIGVPKSEQHQLFSKFYRASNARKARPDGTGIGLFMAKKVIVAHGGAILFESTEGKGSMFGFRLPTEAIQPIAPVQQSAK